MTTSIWEITNNALTGLAIDMGGNVFITASGDALPDTYMVYSLISSPPALAASDKEKLRTYRMQVSVYKRAGLADLPDVDGAMVAAGFSKSLKRELPYNPGTRHFGIALEYIYLQDSSSTSYEKGVKRNGCYC